MASTRTPLPCRHRRRYPANWRSSTPAIVTALPFCRARRPNSSLVDQQVRASQSATRLLHAATVVEAAEIDRRIAEFGDQALDRLLRRDVVTGDEQHPSRVALSRPPFEVRHGDRVERLDHPRTRCMPGDDNACASALKISELQGIERDEWVRGVDEDSALPIGERVGARPALRTRAGQAARVLALRLR